MTAICVINFSHEPNILLAFSGLFVLLLRLLLLLRTTINALLAFAQVLLLLYFCYQIWYTILGGVATSAARRWRWRQAQIFAPKQTHTQRNTRRMRNIFKLISTTQTLIREFSLSQLNLSEFFLDFRNFPSVIFSCTPNLVFPQLCAYNFLYINFCS